MAKSPSALEGVRVLDLANESAAYCGKLLADMGADVIKVEPPDGVAMRNTAPFYAGREARVRDSLRRNRSLFFWHYNTNKRSVTLDFAVERDRQRFVALAASADLIVETFPPGHLDALGLGYEMLAAHNPRLIVVSVTPFGQTGPYRDYRTSDLIAQALGGMVYVNGYPDEAPLQGLGLQAYHSASTFAAIGALLAMLARERTGVGQRVDVSLQACVVASLEHASSSFHRDGTVAGRHGGLHWTRDFRVGRCRDGYVLHCTLGDWTSLIEWVKADGVAQDLGDSSFEDFNRRRDRCAHLFDVLDGWAKSYTVSCLVEGAQLRRLPAAPVLPPETLPHHAQLNERGFFVPVRHDDLQDTLTYPGAPYMFSRTPWRIRHRPPLIGEHNDALYAELDTSRRAQATPGGHATPKNQRACAGEADSAGSGHRATRGMPPLRGVRVIDFTWVVAGPVATRVLADHGAEVIKIERRDATDFGSRRGGLTGNLNRGKQSIVINLNSPRGVDLAKQLIARADVVIDNFSTRVMRNWGLDYDGLRQLKPDIVAVSMSGFGHTGPHRDHVSYGPTLQALAGYTLLMGRPGRAPAGWGFSYSDMAAGYSGALAVLLALWHRRRTGEGQHVDLSQFENLCALLGPTLLDILVNRGTARPVDNGSQEMPAGPHGVFRCADLPGDGPARDRWCAIAVFGDDDWARFCHALGHPGWTRDQRFATASARIENRQALDACVESWTTQRTPEAVMTRLQHSGVAAGVVANAEDLCRRDPQLRARHYWARVTTPEGDTVDLDGLPFTLSDTPGEVCAPGPLLGEQTDAVLQRVLHMSPHVIAELRAAHVVG
jgi:crotonobetainyl-CoA:carnitine CoA-transferase CaiB-like acyl-CoA transferase